MLTKDLVEAKNSKSLTYVDGRFEMTIKIADEGNVEDITNMPQNLQPPKVQSRRDGEISVDIGGLSTTEDLSAALKKLTAVLDEAKASGQHAWITFG